MEGSIFEYYVKPCVKHYRAFKQAEFFPILVKADQELAVT